jgi:hypothetical protein
MSFSGLNLQVLATLAGNAHLLPGAPEPEWLYRRAEHERILAQERAVAAERPATGLVGRLRLVFSRE